MSTNSFGTSGKLWESSVASPVIHYGIYEEPSNIDAAGHAKRHA